MANRGSNSIFVLISIFFYIQLDVVLLIGVDDAPYFDVNKQQDFGIEIIATPAGDTNNLLVTIYSESHTDSAKAFFTQQISENLLQSIKSCVPITLTFSTCTTSTADRNNQRLNCVKGLDQCNDDYTITCVGAAINNDAFEMGKFLICYFSNPNNINECVSKTKINKARFDACGRTNTRYENCDGYSSDFKQQISTAAANYWPSANAINGFKGALCKKLQIGKNQNAVSAVCHALCP